MSNKVWNKITDPLPDYNGCSYLSMPGLLLNQVDKRAYGNYDNKRASMLRFQLSLLH